MSTTHERLGASRCDDGVALKAIEPLRGEIWRTTMPRQIRPTRCVPALDWDLRGQDRGGTLVAIVDDLHQVGTLLGGKPGHGPIVDYEQLYPGELGEQPGGLAVDAGEGEFVEKPGKPLIAHREPATRGLVADGASEETLAATGRAQDQNVVVLVQPAAAGEAVDQAAVETARSAGAEAWHVPRLPFD